ncbi:MAG TPA: hypothetical protein VGK09_11100 [Rhodocyclaceae bacterium]|jgi:hypothetical protein
MGETFQAMKKRTAMRHPLTNDVGLGLKGVSGRTEKTVMRLGGANDGSLATENGFGSGQTDRGYAGIEARQMGLCMTAMIAELLGGCVIAGISSDDRKADFVG